MRHTIDAPIAIIVAMDSERTHLESLIEGWQHRMEGPWPAMETTVGDRPIIVIRCGIGMVAAAAATEHAIAAHDPATVLNFGCAGAHTREILPGDVVIGTEVITHGRMRMAADGTVVPLDLAFTVAGEPEPRSVLQCDPGLVAIAADAASTTTLEAWPEAFRLPMHAEDGAVRIHTGVVSSADIWLQDPAWLDATHQRTGSLCEDMEAAAIAQVCAIHGVPFLTIKDISNNEFHASSLFEGTESALPLTEVGKRAATLTVAVIERITSA